jgi:tetratricopeptide (TPR) repeat protein
MSDDLLARLQAAESAEERDWLVTETLLESLPAELRQAAWAAAVPHWFDASILAALLDREPEECAALYADLQALPFVEPFEARGGQNVHEVTRTAMLAKLWSERRDEYRALSARAAATFADGDEPEMRIEEIYHLLVADPDAGAAALYEQGWKWHDPPLIAYDRVYALAGAALEHAGAGRLDQRGFATANLLSGRIDSLYGRTRKAMDKLEAARERSEPGSRLRAASTQRLGDEHVGLGEYDKAHACYVEALAIHASIGDRAGQAACIVGLGDVHIGLHEYTEARDRYEEARTIYAAIGDSRGKAFCIQGLGDVHQKLGQYAEARERYHEALAIYAATGNRLMEASCLKSLGDVHLGIQEYDEARDRYEEARTIYAATGSRIGETNCIWGQAKVAQAQKDWPEAERLFGVALAFYRELGLPSSTGVTLIRLGVVAEQRGDRPAAARHYKEALEIFEGMDEDVAAELAQYSLRSVRGSKLRQLMDWLRKSWRDR